MAITIDSGKFTFENVDGQVGVELTSGELIVNGSELGGTGVAGGDVYGSGSVFASLTVGAIPSGFCVLTGCRAGSVTFDGGDIDYQVIIDGLYVSTTFLIADILRASVAGLVVGNGSTIGNGIEVFNVPGLQLEGSVRYAIGHGVYLNNCSGGQVDVKVVNPSQVTDNTYDGIHVVNCDNMNITGSVRGAVGVANNPRYGWRVDAASTDIHMDVRVSGAQTAEYQNLAGLEVSMSPRFSTEDPEDGDVPIWDETASRWRPGESAGGGSGGGGGAEVLDDLDDVDTSGATTGDVLKFNGALWVPAEDDVGGGSGGSGVDELAELIDVDLSGATDGDVLTLNSGFWVPVAPMMGGGGGWTLLNDVTLGSDGPIVITGIPDTYDHLLFIGWGRTAGAGTGFSSPVVQVGNGSLDTGSNYAYRAVDHIAVSSSSSDTVIVPCRGCMPENGNAAGASGSFMIYFPFYAETTFWRTVRGMGGGFHASASVYRETSGAGTWKNAADAIERISVNAGASGLLAGSRGILYAM